MTGLIKSSIICGFGKKDFQFKLLRKPVNHIVQDPKQWLLSESVHEWAFKLLFYKECPET